MKSEGHVGFGLFLIAPAALALSFFISETTLYVFIGLIIFFVNMPDIDHRLSRSFIGKMFGIRHRGFTHTIYFAVICGVLTSTLGTVDGLSYGLMFLAGFLGITLHVLGDVVTPTGINFIPKLQSGSYSLNWFNYNNAVANIGFFVLGFICIGLVMSYINQPLTETLLYWILLYIVIAPIVLIGSIYSNYRYDASGLSRYFNPLWWVRRII